jgi:hypothetical protein
MLNTKEPIKMQFDVRARCFDAHGSVAICKSASVPFDTDLAGKLDAFNPAELLLAALAACMIKGIERVIPILKFELRGLRDLWPEICGQRFVARDLWPDGTGTFPKA